jgi:hypothetical protein
MLRRRQHSVPTLGELMPVFAAELEELLRHAGRAELVPQVRGLAVLDRCGCGGDSCAYFYTRPKAVGLEGPICSLPLAPAKGMVVLDLLRPRIVAVEVLDRPDVKQLLDRCLPRVTA